MKLRTTARSRPAPRPDPEPEPEPETEPETASHPGTLELALDAADIPRITRLPGITAARPAATTVVWHDTPTATLAAQGLSLCTTAGIWRLERLAIAGPGQAPTLIAEARRPALLDHPLPEGLTPIVTLRGRRRTMTHGAVTLRLLHGEIEGPHPAALARLRLDGPAAEIAALARAIATAAPTHVPVESLAAQALGSHAGPDWMPGGIPTLDIPPLAANRPADDALASITARLTADMLRWPAQITGATPEPVHQMRVATRRLRSALTVFRTMAPGPATDELRAALGTCAAMLGAARDWDVFISGAAARLAQAFPEERRVRVLLRAGTRQRQAGYQALRHYLQSAAFRTLATDLAAFAALRSWAPHGETTASFAAAALAKRARVARKAGRGINDLPIDALHELRKDCKKLRYTADFFAPLYPAKATRRYTKRLAALQEELGRLNDGAAVQGLLVQLGRAERSYVGGLATGFAAAQAAPARSAIAAAWARFRKTDRFWPSPDRKSLPKPTDPHPAST